MVADRGGVPGPRSMSDAYTATVRVADALAIAGVPYAVGGSIAMAVDVAYAQHQLVAHVGEHDAAVRQLDALLARWSQPPREK